MQEVCGGVGQHHCSVYWYSMLRLGSAATGSESAMARGEAFSLPSNFSAVVTVVGEAGPGSPGGTSYLLEGSAGSSSREGLD